ncbi:MAG: DUF86 domain-containing protein [Candidatus Bathyarchaeia archaeon]
MKQEFLDYIWDLFNNARKAIVFVSSMTYSDFERDEKTQYAVVRALEIMGEAAKKVPGEIKMAYPEIPWREISGMRDKLIHDYTGVNLMVIWRTLQQDLPPLIQHLKRLLSDYGEMSDESEQQRQA